jgi:CRP/FNR family cyclic AMP-dependent transcriptional regulator
MQELASISLFSKMNAQELDKLGKVVKRESFGPNRTVFFEGDRSDALFVIVHGSAKVHQTTDQGKEQILRTVGKGEIFGEFAMFDGQPRSASVTTLESTEMLALHHRDFKAVATSSPDLLWKVIEALCDRVRQLSTEMMDATTKDVPYRLVAKLIQLAEKHGVTDRGGLRIGIKLGAHELANMIASSPARVNQLLTALADKSLVVSEGDRVTVPNLGDLKKALEVDWLNA